jgi:hypothetical protein
MQSDHNLIIVSLDFIENIFTDKKRADSNNHSEHWLAYFKASINSKP